MASCSLDDIENLAFTDADEINVRAPRPSVVMPKVTLIKGNKRGSNNKKNRNISNIGSSEEETKINTGMYNDTQVGGYVPGTETIWMKTFGCAHNVSDGEYMQGMLASYGYTFTETPSDADLWFLNSCTVKNPSETAFMNLVNKGKAGNKKLVVAGCVPQGDRKINGLEDVSIVGISQIDRVTEIVEETLKGNVVRLLSKKTLPSLDLPKIRKNPFVEIVPLSTGCLGACTYCKTRHARGKLGSYTLDALSRRIKQVVKERVAEIWLSSEDTGAWGLDIGMKIPDLLEHVVKLLPEDQSVMLRIGMTNPPYILEHLEAIAKTLNHPCVFSFLHVPLQSGSDQVLKNMNREYDSADFIKVADYLLKHVPGMTLATDIICGFPYETDQDHQDTVRILQKYKLPVVNISQFYPRPGTEAQKMKQLKSQIKKKRSREVTKTFLSYMPYEKTLPVGTKTLAWVSNEVSKDGLNSVAHTKSYSKVLIPRDDRLKGAKIQIKVTTVDKFHVVADVLEVYFKHPHASANFEENFETKGETKKDCNSNNKTEGMFVDGDFCGDDGGCCGSNESECCGGSTCDDDSTKNKNKKPDEKIGTLDKVTNSNKTATSFWDSNLYKYFLGPVIFAIVILQILMYVK
jgi:threonylcarbamoyladenosine tRNA methylthiotransferase CDKAL1